MVRQADFYCALPMLSASLNTALWSSPSFIEQIPYQAKKILGLALKLRHPVLFRECFIHIVGSNDCDNCEDIVYPGAVEILLLKARNKLLGTLLSVNKETIQWLRMKPDNQLPYGVHYSDPPGMDCSLSQSVEYYRELYAEVRIKNSPLPGDLGILTSLEAMLHQLLKNNLVLDRTGLGGTFKYRFLCAELADEDLPWDSSEIDW